MTSFSQCWTVLHRAPKMNASHIMKTSSFRLKAAAENPLGPLPGTLADRLTVPLWHQIAALLQNRIYDGTYPAGSSLPGELQLAEEFGVSRITIRRALEQLALAGLIVRRRGRQTTVATSMRPHLRASTGFVEDLISLFQATQISEIELWEEAAPPHVFEFLERDRVVHIRRTRTQDGMPFSVSDTYLPVDLGRSLDPADLRKLQVLELLDYKLGVPVQEAEENIRAIGAPPDVALRLGLRDGDPVMEMDLLYRADGGRPVACSRVYIAGARYTYRARLFRRTRVAGT